MQTAGALIQFGLLSSKGGLDSRHFEFTSTSLRLTKASPHHLEGHRLMRKAALMPKMHRELFSKFGGARSEDDAAIQHYLVVDRELAHKAAFSAHSARNLIKEYRATMDTAKLSQIAPCSLPSTVFQENDTSFFDFAEPSSARPPHGSAAPQEIEEVGVSPDMGAYHEEAPPRAFIEPAPKTGSPRKSTRGAAKMESLREFAGSAPSRITKENHERVWDQGVLSPTAEYRLLVSGEIGQKEIEVLIRRLEISKETLAGKDEK